MSSGIDRSRARIDDHDLEVVVERGIRPLVATKPEFALALAADALDATLAVTVRPELRERHEDLSGLWRPEIARMEGRFPYGHQRENLLIDLVRDAAVSAVNADPARRRALIEELEGRRWRIFRRIALHLLAEAPEHELIQGRLLDPSVVEEDSPEYTRLLREHFTELTPDEQRRYIGLIEARPAPTTYAGGGAVDPAQAEMWLREWRLRRLSAIARDLPDDVRARYEELRQVAPLRQDDEPAIRDLASPHRQAPLTTDDLLTLPVADIIRHLREWRPTQGYFGPSYRSQGDALVAAARRDPMRFSGHAVAFRDLDPTYVRSLLVGLHDAMKEDRAAIAWEPTLIAAGWAVAQPVGDREGSFERDPGWTWTRQQIANFLGDALTRRENAIPIEHRRAVWPLLEVLSEDPSRSGVLGAEDRDPLLFALNSVRGSALQAIVTYLDWVQRQDPTPMRPAFELAPEAATVMEAHLDPARDSTLVTRGAIGVRLVNLVALDSGWVARHVMRLFPHEDAPQLAVATWRAYIVWNRQFRQLLNLFRDEYSRAIRRTTTEVADAHSDPDEYLAQHLMSFVLRGDLTLEDPLVRDFFVIAPGRVRARAIAFLGQVLRDDPSVTPAHCVRVQRLWASRIDAANTDLERLRDELEQFGWWFSASGCDQEWLLAQLVVAVRLVGSVEPDSLVLKKLAELAPSHPVEAVRVVELLVLRPKERWFVQANFGEIEAVLRSGLDHAESRERAAALVNRLVADGYASLAELLQPK